MSRHELAVAVLHLRQELYSLVCFLARGRPDPEERRKQLESAMDLLEETQWTEKNSPKKSEPSKS